MRATVYGDFLVFDTNCGQNRKCSGRFPSLIYQENSNMSALSRRYLHPTLFSLHTVTTNEGWPDKAAI